MFMYMTDCKCNNLYYLFSDISLRIGVDEGELHRALQNMDLLHGEVKNEFERRPVSFLPYGF